MALDSVNKREYLKYSTTVTCSALAPEIFKSPQTNSTMAVLVLGSLLLLVPVANVDAASFSQIMGPYSSLSHSSSSSSPSSSSSLSSSSTLEKSIKSQPESSLSSSSSSLSSSASKEFVLNCKPGELCPDRENPVQDENQFVEYDIVDDRVERPIPNVDFLMDINNIQPSSGLIWSEPKKFQNLRILLNSLIKLLRRGQLNSKLELEPLEQQSFPQKQLQFVGQPELTFDEPDQELAEAQTEDPNKSFQKKATLLKMSNRFGKREQHLRMSNRFGKREQNLRLSNRFGKRERNLRLSSRFG